MNRPTGPNPLRAAALAFVLAPLLSSVAWAHPHVWVTAKAEIVFAPDGKVTGIRHSWTFDEAYTAYVTQGLDKNNDGKLTPDELQDLAKENTETLPDFDYFTFVKVNGKKQAFDAPRDPGMTMDGDKVVMSYLLPLKTPVGATGSFAIEIDDPSFFVYFTLADGQASIKLTGAPQGCATTIAKAKELDAVTQQTLMDEGLFQTSAGMNLGLQYSNKAIIACP